MKLTLEINSDLSNEEILAGLNKQLEIWKLYKAIKSYDYYDIMD